MVPIGAKLQEKPEPLDREAEKTRMVLYCAS